MCKLFNWGGLLLPFRTCSLNLGLSWISPLSRPYTKTLMSALSAARLTSHPQYLNGAFAAAARKHNHSHEPRHKSGAILTTVLHVSWVRWYEHFQLINAWRRLFVNWNRRWRYEFWINDDARIIIIKCSFVDDSSFKITSPVLSPWKSRFI